jgi:ABC-type glycerol-3-phosphate transport system substrate-binding protein
MRRVSEARRRKYEMKKLILGILVSSAVTVMVGCASDTPTSTSTTTTTEESTAVVHPTGSAPQQTMSQ